MAYRSSGTLTSSKLTIDDSDGWDTQTEWEAYQSATDVEIVSGALQLGEVELSSPNSAVAQFNAFELSGYSDGDTVSTWPDQVSNNDATASGAPVYRASAINGNPAVEFDGTDDSYDAATGTVTQPATVFVVAELTGTSNQMLVSSASDTSNPQWTGSNWTLYAGSSITGSTTSSRQLIGMVLDGANSEIHEDGTQTVTGDVGTSDLGDLGIGYRRSLDDLYADAQIGFVEVHDGLPSDGYGPREQEIADAWGITI